MNTFVHYIEFFIELRMDQSLHRGTAWDIWSDERKKDLVAVTRQEVVNLVATMHCVAW